MKLKNMFNNKYLEKTKLLAMGIDDQSLSCILIASRFEKVTPASFKSGTGNA